VSGDNTVPDTGYTLPGLDSAQASGVVELLQPRLSAYNDLHLTLKHVHWNVVGPTFISVHEMIDPQVELVRGFADAVAERIAALGASPKGTVGAIASDRTWDDYSIGRGTAQAHLGALDLVYSGLIADNRRGIAELEKLDVVTQDLLIGQTGELEKFQWFVRAHLENASGELATNGSTTEVGAARRAKAGAARANVGRSR
jgi:starvation-inducible DNA-binding protein